MGIHLDFYKKYVTSGEIPDFGLCSCATLEYIDQSLLELFKPTQDELLQLIENNISILY